MRTPTAATATLTLLLAVVLTLAPAAPAEAAVGEHVPAEWAFLEAMNDERAARGLPALRMDTDLTRVARGWTARMAREDRLYHNPNLAGQVRIPWSRLAENVGYSRRTGASEAHLVERLHTAFMNSPGHRRNVLGDFGRAGIGVDVAANGTMWVTLNFAKTSAGASTLATPPRPAAAAVAAGLEASRQTFADGEARHVVLARAEVFADALAGAPLAGADGPVLFAPGPDVALGLRGSVASEIDRVLAPGGTVYLLGGPAAVSGDVATALRSAGYDVQRLAGADRVATALAVAEAVVAREGAPGHIVLARDREWADAAVGGAWAAHVGAPVLLTPRDALDPRVAALLARYPDAERVALGGPAALAEPVVAAADAERVAGPDRAATSVAIAERLWGVQAGSDATGFLVVHGGDAHGWAAALAASPASARDAIPQLLVADRAPSVVLDYLGGLGSSLAGVEAGGTVCGEVLTALRRPGG